MNFVKLNLNDMEDILQLQEEVYELLKEKEVLEKLSTEEFKAGLEQGFVAGVFDDNKLIAFRTMYIPALDEAEHLADDVGVSKERSIYSEISLVNPSYRGKKLQTRMGEYLLDLVRDSNEFDHLFTTVMPTNIPSLKDKFRLGFKIMKTSLKYGGKRRHILYLPIKEELKLEGEPLHIKYDNFDWMMTEGREYIGASFKNEYIEYYKK